MYDCTNYFDNKNNKAMNMNLMTSMALLCLALITAPLSQANETSALSDREKHEFIQNSFNANAQHSRYWQNGWLTVFGASAVVHAGIWDQSGSHKESYDAKVTAITSTIATLDMLLNPMKSHKYADQLNSSDVSLTQAESWLEQAAKREQYERSLTSHLLSGLVNGLAGLAVGREDGRKSDGWFTFASGMLASEVKIFTSPTGMTKAWEAYQDGDISPLAANLSTKSRWHIAAAGPILQVRYNF